MGIAPKNKTCNSESLFMPPLDPLLCLWAAEPEHALVESHKVSAQHWHMKTEKHRKTINKRTWRWMKLTNRSHVHNPKKSTNDTLGFVAVWLVQLQSPPTGQSSEKEKTNYVATSLRIVFSFVSFVENRTVLAILDRNCGKWLLEPANVQHKQVDFHGGFEHVGGWPPPMVLK